MQQQTAGHSSGRTALILSSNEFHAKQDYAAIKKLATASVKILTKASSAVAFLAKQRVNVVLLDAALEDMDGISFLQQLRKDSALKDQSVIMVTTENRRDKVLDAISAGCAGYILRPYSPLTFERHLRLAQQTENYPEIDNIQLEEAKDMVRAGDFDDAIEAYEEVLSEQDESRKYYDMGLNYLFQNKYGRAIIAFKKAVKINGLFAEAFKGLAEAYLGKGDPERYSFFMQRAAGIHAQFDRLEEAKDIFIAILKVENKAANPFNTLGVKLRKKGDYQGAIHAYQRAMELTPEDENLYYNVARAFIFMGETEKAKQNAVIAIQKSPQFLEAQVLYEEITGEKWVHEGLPDTSDRKRHESLLDG